MDCWDVKEMDSFSWATAFEPGDDKALPHDGRDCHFHGMCYRDPVQWTLEGVGFD